MTNTCCYFETPRNDADNREGGARGLLEVWGKERGEQSGRPLHSPAHAARARATRRRLAAAVHAWGA